LRLRNPDPVQTAYLKFCNKLAKRGIVRAAHEGAHDFAKRAAQSAPQLADAIFNITQQYLALRYQNRLDELSLPAFKRAVRSFKL
jgi:hypothetical protein